ncbi:hypothetical protein V1477_017025 [Vespula maculifrons]|uniref:Uncharacterized protein n=2 Tax=Vespula TaxID=7451 RepID=A0A834K631_VESVU|nr:hypothetical protein HZH66_005960 [Vespula vulgaris]
MACFRRGRGGMYMDLRTFRCTMEELQRCAKSCFFLVGRRYESGEDAHHENDDDDLLSLTERAHSRRGLEREENTMLAHIPAYPCAPVCQSIENLPEAF